MQGKFPRPWPTTSAVCSPRYAPAAAGRCTPVSPSRPDTNIGASSDERVIYINVGGARLPFTRDAEELTTSGIGLSLWTGGEYQYPLKDNPRLRTGANSSRREYEGRRFDQSSLSTHVGPRWLPARATEASLLASAQRYWSGGTPDHDALGFRIEAGHRFTHRITANPDEFSELSVEDYFEKLPGSFCYSEITKDPLVSC